jgi:hypothetical protein
MTTVLYVYEYTCVTVVGDCVTAFKYCVTAVRDCVTAVGDCMTPTGGSERANRRVRAFQSVCPGAIYASNAIIIQRARSSTTHKMMTLFRRGSRFDAKPVERLHLNMSVRCMCTCGYSEKSDSG